MGNLPHLPEVNVASFAGSQVQPVLEALPVVAPTPSVKEIGFAAAHDAVLQAKAATQVNSMPLQSCAPYLRDWVITFPGTFT